MADLQVSSPRPLSCTAALVCHNYLADTAPLHRFFDPVFAVCVGISAAALRIRREEKEKYPDQNNDYRTLWAKGVRIGKGYFGCYKDEK
jgi:Non-classical export protein 1